MTATPHNGKEEDFQLFLSLLDSDRFYGKFRDGVHKVDASDLMRRMVKEELVKFDGTPLFPERQAYTVNYTLSDIEAALYEAVTDYVQTEMGKADAAARRAQGFRRLRPDRPAAPPRLQPGGHLPVAQAPQGTAGKSPARGEAWASAARQLLAETFDRCSEDDDDLNAEEQENLEETLIDEATAAKTIAELEAEIVILKGLKSRPRPSSPPARTASGMSSRRSCRTTRRCATPRAGSAS